MLQVGLKQPESMQSNIPTRRGQLAHRLHAPNIRQIACKYLRQITCKATFFEATRRDYYEGLRGVSTRGAWLEWLEYFLLGIARMSEDALSRAIRINDLLAAWRNKVAGYSTNTPLRVVDLLAANPFLTISGAANQLKLAFTTAQRAIERLEQNGIVQRISDAKRDRVYCALALLNILEEPAHLKPSNPDVCG